MIIIKIIKPQKLEKPKKQIMRHDSPSKAGALPLQDKLGA